MTDKGKAARKKEQRQQSPEAQRAVNEDGKQIPIALVDLFAGLRTVHVACKGVKLKVVLCNAAEKCEFANRLAVKNNIQEELFLDVKAMNKAWAK